MSWRGLSSSMPEASLAVFIISIALALSFAYANGTNDAANAVATVISTRSMSPMAAIAMGAALNLVGALVGFWLGSLVAKTIGEGLVDPGMITQFTVIAAIAASVLWVFAASWWGLPVSVSHSLVASLVGSGLATGGVGAIQIGGLTKVLIALALSPALGFLFAFLAGVGLIWLMRKSSPAGNRRLFKPLQILSGAFLAFSHGRNDSQNAVGIIALAATFYFGRELSIDLWMIIVSAVAIGLGTAIGGMRVIRTLGMRVTKLEPMQGFVATTAGATLIEAASQIGLPVSTTHTISGSIIGVGATRRLSAVRWGVTRNIALAWLVTYPICFVLGWTISTLLGVFF